MSKNLLKYIIKIIFIIFISKHFLYPVFYPVLTYKKEKGINAITYISEMYENLTIYKEKYTKTGFEIRYFKNGCIYYGNFIDGSFNGESLYYKMIEPELYKKYDFFFLLAEITKDILLSAYIKSNKIFLIYLGLFNNGFIEKGLYIDSENGVIYNGEWKNNKINGEGYIYFEIGCYILGEFKDNILEVQYLCECPKKPKSFCDSKLYFKIHVENFLIKEDVNWEKTLAYNMTKKSNIFIEIFIPIIWIFFIIIEDIIIKKIISLLIKINNIHICKKNLVENNLNENYIINEAKNNNVLISTNDSIKFGNKAKNCVFKFKYTENGHNLSATGFFCKFKLKDINLEMVCFFTNYHTLKDVDKLKENKEIIIELKNDSEKKCYIKINKKTKIFFGNPENNKKNENKNLYLDYICIEVNENKIEDFFLIDDRMFMIENKNDNVILFAGFPHNSIHLLEDRGKIINAKQNCSTFFHNLNTSEGNSGSPICNINSYLIGIHCGFTKINDNKTINFGIFFNYILEDIKKQYVKLIIENQPIFTEKEIGYFCELKTINCKYLLTEYEIYSNLIVNKTKLKYRNLLGQNKEINLKTKNRFIISAKRKNFAILELLKEEDINYCFNFLDIDEQIKKREIDIFYKKKDLGLIENNFSNNNINANYNFIGSEDFFQSIENYGYNIEDDFNGLKNYPNGDIQLKDFLDVYEIVNNFMEQAIKNLYNKIEGKKYYPRCDYLKYIIKFTFIFLLILPYISTLFKEYDFNKIKDNITDKFKNSKNKFANIEIKKDENLNNILFIKSGIFNSINLTKAEKELIYSIQIEKGSKIIGDCSFLFSYFINCKNIGIENLDTINVTNMNYMFYKDKSLVSLNLKNFNTSKVISMEGMFEECIKLVNIQLSSFDTQNVESTNSMFKNCISLNNLDLSNFKTSNLKYMQDMFSSCNSLQQLNIYNFDTSKVVNMSGLFSFCKSLVDLNLINFNTSNVKDMGHMFQVCYSLKKLDLSNFDTSKVENMKFMFCALESLIELKISNFNTTNVKNMEFMFVLKLIKYLDLSNFNTINVENMDSMFQSCESLKEIKLSNFKTNNVKNMEYMFHSCKSLEKLDLTSFNTSNVLTMKAMFLNCFSLKYVKIFNFNTEKVKDMSYMFSGCFSLKELNMKNFNTSNVETLEKMFDSAHSLISLDLSSFNTKNVRNMNEAFYRCYSLKTLDISNFVFRETSIWGIFDYTSPYLKVITGNEYILEIYEKSPKSEVNPLEKGLNWIKDKYKNLKLNKK